MPDMSLDEVLSSDSFLEYAFLRWVLTPAFRLEGCAYVRAQHPVAVSEHTYRLDYAFEGSHSQIAVELDGYAFHGSPDAFTYDGPELENVSPAATIFSVVFFAAS